MTSQSLQIIRGATATGGNPVASPPKGVSSQATPQTQKFDYRAPSFVPLPHAQQGPSTTIFVRPLPESADEVYLWTMFASFGTVVATKILRNVDGSSRCDGFVEFATRAEAESAFVLCHKPTGMSGRTFRISWAQRPLHWSIANGSGGLCALHVLQALNPSMAAWASGYGQQQQSQLPQNSLPSVGVQRLVDPPLPISQPVQYAMGVPMQRVGLPLPNHVNYSRTPAQFGPPRMQNIKTTTAPHGITVGRGDKASTMAKHGLPTNPPNAVSHGNQLMVSSAQQLYRGIHANSDAVHLSVSVPSLGSSVQLVGNHTVIGRQGHRQALKPLAILDSKVSTNNKNRASDTTGLIPACKTSLARHQQCLRGGPVIDKTAVELKGSTTGSSRRSAVSMPATPRQSLKLDAENRSAPNPPPSVLSASDMDAICRRVREAARLVNESNANRDTASVGDNVAMHDERSFDSKSSYMVDFDDEGDHGKTTVHSSPSSAASCTTKEGAVVNASHK
jgi:hypothetical protein